MSLPPRTLILLAIESFGDQIRGKTLLQKRLYFLGVILNEDLGFRAHYYGPYSETINDSLQALKTSGLVEESQIHYGAYDSKGFEQMQYNFQLTPDGKAAIQSIESRERPQSDRVRMAAKAISDAGVEDYIGLSIAAKVHYVLKRASKPLTNSEILDEARKLNWKFDETKVQTALGFLRHLDLVTSPTV